MTRMGAKRGERHVGADAERQHGALRLAVLRHIGEAGARSRRRASRIATALPSILTLAARSARLRPNRPCIASERPAPIKPVEADDLARAQRERDAVEFGGVGEIDGFQHDRARAWPRAWDRPDRSIGRPSGRTRSASLTSAIAPAPTCSPSRRQVQRSATRKISSNLCEMNRIAQSCCLQLLDDREEFVDLVRGQRRGRLVHDDDARVMRQRARDLDQMLLRDAERLDRRRRRRNRASRRFEQRRASSRASLRQSTRPPADAGMWPMKMFSATTSSSNITVS